jgi:hypothetical protein
VIAGHFGLAAATKAVRPSIPLWSLMLATVWLDVLFGPLFAANIERLEDAPGQHGVYGGSVIYADYTHSLLGALVLSALYGLLFLRRWGRPAALILAAVAFSHWLLDLVVHRADMPLLPGNLGDLPRLGFGAWRYPVIAALLEVALVIVGGYLYWRAARRADPHRTRPHLLAAGIVAAGLAVLGLNVAVS